MGKGDFSRKIYNRGKEATSVHCAGVLPCRISITIFAVDFE